MQRRATTAGEGTPRAQILLSMCAALVAFFVLMPFSTFAQLSVRGGNATLAITTAAPGSQPTPVTDVSTQVRYREQSVITKITVSTSCPGQKFTLKALAVSPQRGVPAPEVTLVDGMPSAEFIQDIPTGNRNRTSTIQYTASATFAQGNSVELGPDVHTVTYTLVAQ